MKSRLARGAAGAPRAAERPRPAAKPGPATAARMTVTGRVLDPDGKPAAGVPVDIIGAPRTPESGTDVEREPYVLLGQGAADGDGRFRIEAARTSSARFFDVYALAGAAGPGSGFGCVKLNPDAEQPAAEIHLRPEQVIRGRLVDVSGQPAAGVEVQLQRRLRRVHPARRRALRQPRPSVATSGPTRPRASAPGRRPSPPTPRAGSPSPASAAASTSPWPSATPASPSSDFDLEASERDAAQGGRAGPPAGDDHRGPRPGRRHRPAHPRAP